MFHVYLKSHKRFAVQKENKVCVWGERGSTFPIDLSDNNFDTDSTGKSLDVINPENTPKKPVIDWASLRENRAKYEAMKWAG